MDARVGAFATAKYVTGPYRLEVIEDGDHAIAQLLPHRVADLIVGQLESPV